MKEPTRLYNYVRDQDYVHVQVIGLYQARPDSHRFAELVEFMHKYNCKKCLFDYRKGIFEIDVWTAYNRPKLAKKFKLLREHRIAAVYKELTDDIIFNETVFRNQGYSVKVFTDFDAAVSWLAG
jgi:hypothetical protein